jgi:hypothetical protein
MAGSGEPYLIQPHGRIMMRELCAEKWDFSHQEQGPCRLLLLIMVVVATSMVHLTFAREMNRDLLTASQWTVTTTSIMEYGPQTALE